MGSFNRDNKKSGGSFSRGFDGGKSFGGPKQMHQATCSECGASCEVPFRPTGERPVFCSNCFKNQGSGGRPNKFGSERHERPNFADKQMHDVVCIKCGKNCQVPFRPTPGKPVFCSDCFKQGGSGGKGSGEVIEQIRMLNAKIDKLMKMLIPNALVEKIEKPEVKKEVMTKKVVKEKKEKTKIKVASKKASAKKKK